MVGPGRRGDIDGFRGDEIDEGMVVLLLFMWATFLAMVAAEVRRRSPALLFVLGVILVAGVPLTAHGLGSSQRGSVDSQVVQYIIVFNCLFVLARLLLPLRQVVPVSFVERDSTLTPAERRVIAVVVLVFLSTLLLKLAGAGFSVSTLVSRTWRDAGDLDLLMTYSAHASFGLILCFIRLRRFALAGVAMLAVLLLLLLDRSRALALAAMGPLLFVSISGSLRGRTRVFKVATTILLSGLAIVGFYLVQEIRYRGALTSLQGVGVPSLVEPAIDRLMRLEGEFSLARSIGWLMTDGDQVEGYGEGRTLVRMLLFWLPADLKPPELTHSIAAAYARGGSGASYHPTVYGLAWADGRWAGLAYAGLLAVAFHALDLIVRRFNRGVLWTILLGPVTVFAVLTARGSVYNAWVTMIVTLVFLLGVFLAMGAFRERSRNRVAHA